MFDKTPESHAAVSVDRTTYLRRGGHFVKLGRCHPLRTSLGRAIVIELAKHALVRTTPGGARGQRATRVGVA